jgi:hypothetical protein
MTRNTIFVSYAWQDEHWQSEIYTHLDSINRNLEVKKEIWIDKEKLTPGDTIDREVKDAIARSQIAVLLVSASFLTSDYIQNIELPALRKAGVRLYPILVEPCPYRAIPSYLGTLMVGARDDDNKLIPLAETRENPDSRISVRARQILSSSAEQIIELIDEGESTETSSIKQPNRAFEANTAAEIASPSEGAEPEIARPAPPVEAPGVNEEGRERPSEDTGENRYVEVELMLQHRGIDYYQAELRLTQSNDDNDRYPHFVHLDTRALAGRAASINDYGDVLTESLFPGRFARSSIILEKAMEMARKEHVPVRFRLCISPSAMELQEVQWEALRNPLSETSRWLLDPSTDNGKWPQIAFSRHIMGSDQRWREVYLRAKPRDKARALVVVAEPSEGSLKAYNADLTPIVRSDEEELATRRLANSCIVYGFPTRLPRSIRLGRSCSKPCRIKPDGTSSIWYAT